MAETIAAARPPSENLTALVAISFASEPAGRRRNTLITGLPPSPFSPAQADPPTDQAGAVVATKLARLRQARRWQRHQRPAAGSAAWYGFPRGAVQSRR